ncbi:MAG: ribose 5-phosphate isomerase B [Actinomycetota bacterium]|nr:ribose 5-phosphate isomerase B [Actinomycetota bacterium]
MSSQEGAKVKRLVIGSDHAGFLLKQDLVEHLRKKGYDVLDIGTADEGSVDYPDFAAKGARLVAQGKFSLGVLVCGSGVGVAIAANKVAGIRAVTANDPELARLSRAHNDANMLAIGARFVGPEAARAIVDIWLETAFEGGRHQKRVDKITLIERDERS